MWSKLVLFLTLLLQSHSVLAAVHPYYGEYFYAVGDAYIFRGGREGMYASTQEAIEKWGDWGRVAPGLSNGQAEIKFTKLEFHRAASVASQYAHDEGFTGLVQAVVFEVGDRDRVGFPTPLGRRYCCTKELVPKTKCFQDRLIYEENEFGWPKVMDIYFENNDTVAYSWEEAITIEETGMYYLWFVVCDEDLSAATVAGQTIWKNPDGYLPGMMAPNLTFYGIMTLAYSLLGAAWMVLYAKWWKDVLTLQHWISGVIALAMMEASTWYFDYVQFNATGARPVLTTLWAVFLGATRKTLSRMLVLVVSMGFGVVLPYLGAMQRKVITLGVCYFLAVMSLDTVSNVGAIDDLTSTARIVLVLPVAILDAVFILWIFTSLSKTLNQLATRKQVAKLGLYRRFTNILAACVWISVAWIAYEMYHKVSDQFNEKWQSEWITNAFWQVVNYLFLACICWLWRPSDVVSRFAYSDLDDEYDMVERQSAKMEAMPLKEGVDEDGDGEEVAKLD